MHDWKTLQAARPGDAEKRTIIALVRRLARATGKPQEEVYEAARKLGEKMAKKHQREFLLKKHKDILG